MVWNGLGVCYFSKQANWASDAAYFKSIGLKNIRVQPHVLYLPWSAGDPNVEGSFAYWRACAQYFKSQGFYVTYGVSGASIPGMASAYKYGKNNDAVVAEVKYWLANGIAVDQFEIGNEHEGFLTSGMSSLTQSNGVITVNVGQTHNLAIGDPFIIYGATPAAYNGRYHVASLVDTQTITLTETISSSTTSPATVTGTCYTLTVAAMNQTVRDLATRIKALNGWAALGMKLSYACFDGNYNGDVSAYTDWAANGIGDLDYLSVHPYGHRTASNYVLPGGYLDLAKVSSLGDKVFISEFNLDYASGNLAKLPSEEAVSAMNYWYKHVKHRFSKAFVYCWEGYLNQDNQFAMKNMDGSFNDTWFVLLADGGRLAFTNN